MRMSTCSPPLIRKLLQMSPIWRVSSPDWRLQLHAQRLNRFNITVSKIPLPNGASFCYWAFFGVFSCQLWDLIQLEDRWSFLTLTSTFFSRLAWRDFIVHSTESRPLSDVRQLPERTRWSLLHFRPKVDTLVFSLYMCFFFSAYKQRADKPCENT